MNFNQNETVHFVKYVPNYGFIFLAMIASQP